MYTAELEVD